MGMNWEEESWDILLLVQSDAIPGSEADLIEILPKLHNMDLLGQIKYTPFITPLTCLTLHTRFRLGCFIGFISLFRDVSKKMLKTWII